MNRVVIGRMMIGLGALLVVIGVVGWLIGGEDDELVATTSATEAPATTTEGPAPTSTSATSSPTTTTTITISTTTSTTTPGETIDEFVAAFRVAIDADDLDFVFSRLHPGVIEAYGEDLCRTWVEREILALEQYEVTGPHSELGNTTVDLPGGSVPVEELFEVPISFVFQGQSFVDTASYAREGGIVYWLGNCR